MEGRNIFRNILVLISLSASTCLYSQRSAYTLCYKIHRESSGIAAAGGQGVISVGFSGDGRPLAIKRSTTPEGIAALKREASRLEEIAVQDPRGVFVRGRFDPELQALVTEIPPGAIPLDQWLNHLTTLPSREKIEIITRQLEEVRDVLARAKVLHGDLVPRNILITPEGKIKIIDLGGGPSTSDAASLRLVASELDIYAHDLASRFTDHHQGEPSTPEALAFLKLPSESQVSLLGKGGEGSVFRVVAPTGETDVIKLYQVDPGFNPETMQIVRTPEERAAVKKKLFSRTVSTLEELGSHSELLTGALRVIQLREVYEEAFAYRMSDAKGYTLVDLNKRGLETRDQKEFASRYEVAAFEFLQKMRNLGWETERLKSLDRKLGEWSLPGFEIRKGGVRFSITGANVVVNPTTLEMTLIDLE